MSVTNGRPVKVRDATRSAWASVDEAATPKLVLAAMDRIGVDELPVVGKDGKLRGMVERTAVDRHLFGRGEEDITALQMAEAPVVRANPDEGIERALDDMLGADLDVLPVVTTSGRCEGLLVRADLQQVPRLVETVADDRRRRALAAEAGFAKVKTACGLLSAALGVALFVLWANGPGYGLPRWVGWADGLAALLALIGAATVYSREMFSIPVWAVGGVGLAFAAMLAHAWHDGVGSTWVQLALAAAFFVMVIVYGAAWPRRRRATSERTATRPVASATT